MLLRRSCILDFRADVTRNNGGNSPNSPADMLWEALNPVKRKHLYPLGSIVQNL
jgi:hypothetical protein